MKRILKICMAVLFLISCGIQLYSAEALTVAIIPFGARSISEDEAMALSDILENRLAQLGNFELVERDRIEDIMQELKFASSDFVDASTAVKAGKLLSAHYLFLGNISVLGSKFHVNLKLVNTDTGKIVHAANGESKNIMQLKTVVEKLAKDLSSYIMTDYIWSVDLGLIGLFDKSMLHSSGVSASVMYAIKPPLAVGLYIGGFMKTNKEREMKLVYGGKILIGDPRRIAVSVTLSHFPSIGLYYEHVFFEFSPLMLLGVEGTWGATIGYSISN